MFRQLAVISQILRHFTKISNSIGVSVNNYLSPDTVGGRQELDQQPVGNGVSGETGVPLSRTASRE